MSPFYNFFYFTIFYLICQYRIKNNASPDFGRSVSNYLFTPASLGISDLTKSASVIKCVTSVFLPTAS